MNRQKAQQEITSIIEVYRAANGKAARKQYPASKKNIARAAELGILEMIPNMPYGSSIGNTEIQLVIAAAEKRATAVFNADGEGEAVGASALWLALNEADEPTEPEPVDTLEAIAAEVTRVRDIGGAEMLAAANAIEPRIEAFMHSQGYERIRFSTGIGYMVDGVPCSPFQAIDALVELKVGRPQNYLAVREQKIAESRGEGDMVQLNVRIPEEMLTELKNQSVQSGVRISEIVRRALARELGIDVPNVQQGGAR